MRKRGWTRLGIASRTGLMIDEEGCHHSIIYRKRQDHSIGEKGRCCVEKGGGTGYFVNPA